MRQSERKIIKLLRKHRTRVKKKKHTGAPLKLDMCPLYSMNIVYHYRLPNRTRRKKMCTETNNILIFINYVFFILKIFSRFFPLHPCHSLFFCAVPVVTRRFSRWLHKNNNALEHTVMAV